MHAGIFHLGMHRIRERLGLEGTIKVIWVQSHCQGQGQFPLHQAAQSPIQSGPEHFQGWDICLSQVLYLLSVIMSLGHEEYFLMQEVKCFLSVWLTGRSFVDLKENSAKPTKKLHGYFHSF